MAADDNLTFVANSTLVQREIKKWQSNVLSTVKTHQNIINNKLKHHPSYGLQ